MLCDWADPDLGYCSLAEQGGMIAETPTLLLELIDNNAIRGWFPSGGVFLVNTATGERTRIDADTAGAPLTPSWKPDKSCGGQCDYHQNPRLHITTDAVSGDGHLAAFCANYEAPREPTLYVKNLTSGELTRTSVRCGVDRFGPEDDNDEWNDEGMSYPTVSADGTVVHVNGDASSGGDYGRVGWQADTLYFPGTGESREVPGSGSMTRDGSTVFVRSGEQAEVAASEVKVEYATYDVGSRAVTPLPWLKSFLASTTTVAPRPDVVSQASDDGRLILNRKAVYDVSAGKQVDIADLLRAHDYSPSDEWGPLRISGDGSTIVADVVVGDPLREDGGTQAVLITSWDAAPVATETGHGTPSPTGSGSPTPAGDS